MKKRIVWDGGAIAIFIIISIAFINAAKTWQELILATCLCLTLMYGLLFPFFGYSSRKFSITADEQAEMNAKVIIELRHTLSSNLNLEIMDEDEKAAYRIMIKHLDNALYFMEHCQNEQGLRRATKLIVASRSIFDGVFGVGDKNYFVKQGSNN